MAEIKRFLASESINPQSSRVGARAPQARVNQALQAPTFQARRLNARTINFIPYETPLADPNAVANFGQDIASAALEVADRHNANKAKKAGFEWEDRSREIFMQYEQLEEEEAVDSRPIFMNQYDKELKSFIEDLDPAVQQKTLVTLNRIRADEFDKMARHSQIQSKLFDKRVYDEGRTRSISRIREEINPKKAFDIAEESAYALSPGNTIEHIARRNADREEFYITAIDAAGRRKTPDYAQDIAKAVKHKLSGSGWRAVEETIRDLRFEEDSNEQLRIRQEERQKKKLNDAYVDDKVSQLMKPGVDVESIKQQAMKDYGNGVIDRTAKNTIIAEADYLNKDIVTDNEIWKQLKDNLLEIDTLADEDDYIDWINENRRLISAADAKRFRLAAVDQRVKELTRMEAITREYWYNMFVQYNPSKGLSGIIEKTEYDAGDQFKSQLGIMMANLRSMVGGDITKMPDAVLKIQEQNFSDEMIAGAYKSIIFDEGVTGLTRVDQTNGIKDLDFALLTTQEGYLNGTFDEHRALPQMMLLQRAIRSARNDAHFNWKMGLVTEPIAGYYEQHMPAGETPGAKDLGPNVEPLGPLGQQRKESFESGPRGKMTLTGAEPTEGMGIVEGIKWLANLGGKTVESLFSQEAADARREKFEVEQAEYKKRQELMASYLEAKRLAEPERETFDVMTELKYAADFLKNYSLREDWSETLPKLKEQFPVLFAEVQKQTEQDVTEQDVHQHLKSLVSSISDGISKAREIGEESRRQFQQDMDQWKEDYPFMFKED